MDVVYQTCCGIDVQGVIGYRQEIKEFSAKIKAIKAMVDWLEGNKYEGVAIESTFVY